MPDHPAQRPAIAESPLAEAQPDSLQRYFSMDPLELTRQDRDIIVAELRKRREQWKRDEAAGKIRASAPKVGKAPRKSAQGTLSLDDLDL